ncbi:co-chaperone GroES [candidate division WWE3 bacterium]|uniref:Co-chaperonin GroES n=1 Tax=candidate division WWE3 bacterium TaxID=2053526 RepID=A0A955LHC9_UNCKA|nr:co-chaperone GroES [candidate division WWE3 bacterium]
MSKKVQPLGDKLLVRPYSKEEKTESGIILPETSSKERPEEGEVLAMGNGARDDSGKLIPIEDVTVGDRVVFTKYGPQEIKVDGEELLIVSIKDILAKIEE